MKTTLPQERATSHLMRPLGPDCGAYTSASLPVFLRPLCQLRSVRFQKLSAYLNSGGRDNKQETYQSQSSACSAASS